MKLKKSARDTANGLDALDAQMDSYLNWRRHCSAVAASYRTWSLASRSQRDAAFQDYMAALALEEHAARAYSLLGEPPHMAEPMTRADFAIDSRQAT